MPYRLATPQKYKELCNKAAFYPLIFTIAMRFYGQKAVIQKIVEINHKLHLLIVYQRIYFPLFDK